MSALSLDGLGPLSRLALRLDRLRVAVWAVGLGVVTVMVGATWDSLYPTAESRRQFAAEISATPALTGLLGPLHDPLSTGALTAWRIGAPLAFVLGVVGVFLVVRHTRAEESDGRRDVQLSGVVARPAPALAALVPSLVLGLGFTAVSLAGMVALGQGIAGALAFGLVVAGGGIAIAALAGLLALALPSARGARAVGVFIAALSFGVFVLANATPELAWLRWVTPLGWVGEALPFAGERWEVVAMPWLVAGVLAATAAAVSVRRDIGSSLVRPRAGRPRAAAWLSGPAAITWRTERSVVVGWTLGLGVLAVLLGAVMRSVVGLIEDSPQLAELLRRMGGVSGAADSYIVMMMSILSIGVAAFGVAGVLRARSDEAAGRSAVVITTPTSRVTWLGVRIVLYAVATVVLLAVLGLGLALGFGGSVGSSVGAAVLAWPAVLLVLGVAVAAVGRWPALWWFAWLVVAYSVLIGQFGALLGLPEWTQDTTPFAVTPLWPAESIAWMPPAGATIAAAVLIGAGLAGYRARDLG